MIPPSNMVPLILSSLHLTFVHSCKQIMYPHLNQVTFLCCHQNQQKYFPIPPRYYPLDNLQSNPPNHLNNNLPKVHNTGSTVCCSRCCFPHYPTFLRTVGRTPDGNILLSTLTWYASFNICWRAAMGGSSEEEACSIAETT